MDQYLFEKINSLAGLSKILDLFFVFCAVWLGYLALAVLAVLILNDWRRYLKMSVVAVVSAGIARFVFVTIIRFFYENPRPFVELDNVRQLIFHETSSSLPSGHATFYFAIAAVIYFFEKKWGIIFFVSALLIGLSRVVAGVHWPLDIISGAILGSATGFLSAYLSKKYIN